MCEPRGVQDARDIFRAAQPNLTRRRSLLPLLFLVAELVERDPLRQLRRIDPVEQLADGATQLLGQHEVELALPPA